MRCYRRACLSSVLLCLCAVFVSATRAQNPPPLGRGPQPVGLLQCRDDLTLIDLPGVYSLTPYSEDARVAVDVLQGKGKLREQIAARPAWLRWSIYYAGTVAVLLLGAFYDTNPQFIYFRF